MYLQMLAETQRVLRCALIELVDGRARLSLGRQLHLVCMYPVDAHVDLATVAVWAHVMRAVRADLGVK
mgnify:CR=1 FL=1